MESNCFGGDSVANNFFEDWFGSFLNPKEQLDKDWKDACMSGNFAKYSNTLDTVKKSGHKVYRNSKGIHKVV